MANKAVIPERWKPKYDECMQNPYSQSIIPGMLEELGAAEQRAERAEAERNEAKAEVAACLKFLHNEMCWEGFREEMYCKPDDEPKRNASANNQRKLLNYLKATGHGIEFLKSVERAEEEAGKLRAIVEAIQYSGPAGCPVCLAPKNGQHGMSCDIGKALLGKGKPE